jgi:hypothetical protein
MISLQQLDGKQVGVLVPLTGHPVWIYGNASFTSGDDVPQLKITVLDSTGSFDILIKEAEWTGTIERNANDRSPEFLIRLQAPVPAKD